MTASKCPPVGHCVGIGEIGANPCNGPARFIHA
jgi:hypothetical protein